MACGLSACSEVPATIDMMPGGGGDGPAAPCDPTKCGLECFDPATCGGCGNGVCDLDETHESCPSDCCNPNFCSSGNGPPYPAGNPVCMGAPDGTVCDDGEPRNGVETCK